MGAPGHTESHDHNINDKATGGMVVLTLALFFVMTVVGHFVFVANQHPEEAPSATEIHEEH
ncbi:MAG: hypothetical protein ACXW4B_10580 [Micavibrio sp.]